MATLTTKPAPKAAPKAPKQKRFLVESEVHVVESALTSRNPALPNLFSTVIDLAAKKAVITQTTRPTSVDADGVDDIIAYFTRVKEALTSKTKKVALVEEADDSEE